MKHTAVKFLLEKYKSQNTLLFSDDFEQAKEIESQQQGYSEEDMKLSFDVGFQVGYNDETSPSYLTFYEWFNKYKNGKK